MTAHAHAVHHVTGLWWKVITAAVIAGVLAGGSAIVTSFVNSSRIGRAETELQAIDDRQREMASDVAALKTDVGYSRRALDRLLWHQGISLPPDDGEEPYVSSSE